MGLLLLGTFGVARGICDLLEPFTFHTRGDPFSQVHEGGNTHTKLNKQKAPGRYSITSRLD